MDPTNARITIYEVNNEAVFNKLKTNEGLEQTNLKFVDLGKIVGKADSLQSKSRVAIAIAGVVGGVVAAVKLAALGGMLGAGAAAMATPVGWAALGLAAVGLGILAARHLYLKSQGMETDLMSQLANTAKTAAITFFSAAAIALVIIAAFSEGGGGSSYNSGGGGGGGEGFLDGLFAGYMLHSVTESTADVMVFADATSFDKPIGPKPGKHDLVYPGDSVKVTVDEEGHKSYRVIRAKH